MKGNDRMTEMIHDLARALAKALESGKSEQDAARMAETEIRHKYGGERIYVAAFPKSQRLRQISSLDGTTTRELATASGIPVRSVRRLLRGR